MAFFQWDQKYSVGVKELDDQHQKLVQLLNQLFEAMQAGKGNDVLGKILDELVRYTSVHFSTEERLMKSRNYSELETHKTEHAALTKKASDLQQQFKAGKTTLTLEVSRFLKEGLSNHILQTDKKYTPVLKG